MVNFTFTKTELFPPAFLIKPSSHQTYEHKHKDLAIQLSDSLTNRKKTVRHSLNCLATIEPRT